MSNYCENCKTLADENAKLRSELQKRAAFDADKEASFNFVVEDRNQTAKELASLRGSFDLTSSVAASLRTELDTLRAQVECMTNVLVMFQDYHSKRNLGENSERLLVVVSGALDAAKARAGKEVTK
jgi:predicted nuclease with TOPRIM domain